ncbi:MAG: 50S ribosomal protein L10 [Candidatus Marinimicrobia bacterium]|nr:50S ribosomal protein L10 [Candidatus Neomarinimicrobiota bacterium]
MPNTKNINSVEELRGKIEKASAIYFTDFLGLDVARITELRKQFYDTSIEYKVVKNTLLKIAAAENNISGLEEILKGSTAIAISYDEPTTPAQVLKKFTKDHDLPKVKGILFDGEVLGGEEFLRIADLPSRDELLSMLVAMLQSPMTKFVRTLSAPMSNMVGVLNSLKDQKS